MTHAVRLKVGLLVLTLLGVIGVAAAGASGGDHREASFSASLSGYEEVPALSTTGTGWFRAELGSAGDTVTYRLRYSGLTAVQAAHVHFGQEAVNGGVSAFLCSNMTGAPAGTPACPATGGTVSGTLTAASVVGPAAQGITAGELTELLAAMQAEVAYVNVHTTAYPGGEIRGQVEGRGDGGRDD